MAQDWEDGLPPARRREPIAQICAWGLMRLRAARRLRRSRRTLGPPPGAPRGGAWTYLSRNQEAEGGGVLCRAGRGCGRRSV
eukprot:8267460-Pyramimonas_sp.AAC.1